MNSPGRIENLVAVDLSTLPPPPIGANLLYGTFSFNITGIDLRGDVTLFLTFPDVLPPGTVYWKFQANHDPQWYSITPDEINGNHMTITLTDGGIGDDDGFANRAIYDPGGPGMPQTSGMPENGIPEFPTVAMPIITVIGLMFLFQRRKGK